MAAIPGNTSTTSVLTGTGTYFSTLETNGDSDWWRVNTVAGLTYDFTLSGDGGPNSLDDAHMIVRDASGNQLGYQIIYNGQSETISLTATSAGPYYIDIVDPYTYDGLAEGSYRLVARMHDKLVNNNTTTAVLHNGTIAGSLEADNDSDWYRVTLTAGQTVDFHVSGDGSVTTLDDARIILRDSNGNQINYNTSYNGERAGVSHTVTTTGTYFVEIRDNVLDGSPEGSYLLTSRLSDKVPANNSTNAVLRDGSAIVGTIDAANDNDWVRFSAEVGRTYTFSLTGTGASGQLPNSILELRNSAGTRIDYDYGYGANDVATVTITAAQAGTYYLDVSGRLSSDWGSYRLSVISDSRNINGTAGNDSMTGGAVDNLMQGLTGNDYLNGGAGNDTLIGGMGNDTLIGGEGIDTAIYDGASGSRVHLGYTTAQNTWHGSDMLSGIENLTGGTGMDVFFGDAAANVLRGMAGNDQLYGGGGNDTVYGGNGNDYLHGGAGFDWAVFDGPQAVVVEMRGNRVTGQGTDTIAGIENIQTGSGNDRITGNAHRNELIGGAGNDTIAGGGGSDDLTGGSGADHFVFGDYEGNDRITDFQNGIDRIVIEGDRADRFVDLSISNWGGSTVISWGAGTSIVVAGVSVAAIDSSDFIFA